MKMEATEVSRGFKEAREGCVHRDHQVRKGPTQEQWMGFGSELGVRGPRNSSRGNVPN